MERFEESGKTFVRYSLEELKALKAEREEAAIQCGIDADPDNPELTPERIKAMVPFKRGWWKRGQV